MPIFQCYSETLGSASVKSELCPFILHLYMKNVTAKKIQLSCIFTRQTDCVAKENRFKGEFNLNITTFPNPISQSAPKINNQKPCTYIYCNIINQWLTERIPQLKKASILTDIYLDHSSVEQAEKLIIKRIAPTCIVK